MEGLRRGERGQVMVLFALMSVVLFGVLALIVDIGYGFSQRRYMQNAADAASIAAARHLGLSRVSGTTDGAVRAVLDRYLAANGDATLAAATGPDDGAWFVQVDGSSVSPVGAGSTVPSSAAGVRVNATRTFPTFFASVIGFPTMTVKATATAVYGSAQFVFLNWKKTGVMIMPLAFDVDAYGYGTRGGPPCNGGFGREYAFMLYVDTPSDCGLGLSEMHFSFSTLNIGNDCSNNTTKDVLDRLLNDPESLGDSYVEPGVTRIQVCHGARATTWEQIPVNVPFLVPVIGHVDAASCNPSCWPTLLGFRWMQKTGMGGTGVNTYLRGFWPDPRQQKMLTGTGVSSSSSSDGPISFSLVR